MLLQLLPYIIFFLSFNFFYTFALENARTTISQKKEHTYIRMHIGSRSVCLNSARLWDYQNVKCTVGILLYLLDNDTKVKHFWIEIAPLVSILCSIFRKKRDHQLHWQQQFENNSNVYSFLPYQIYRSKSLREKKKTVIQTTYHNKFHVNLYAQWIGKFSNLINYIGTKRRTDIETKHFRFICVSIHVQSERLSHSIASSNTKLKIAQKSI